MSLYFSICQLEISIAQLGKMAGQLMNYSPKLLKTIRILLIYIREPLISVRKLEERFYQLLFSSKELIIYTGELINVIRDLPLHIPRLINENLQLGDRNHKCVKEYYKGLNGGWKLAEEHKKHAACSALLLKGNYMHSL